MSLLFIAALAVYQILLFFVHAAVYQSIVAAFGWHWSWLAWLFGFLSVSFVTASLLAHEIDNVVVKWYYRVSAYWFGLIHFLFVGAFAFYILEVIIYGTDRYVSPVILGGITMGVAFLLHAYATWQTSRPKIMRITVSLANLPKFWRGKKVVFASDLHIGIVWNERLVGRVVDLVRAESPESFWIGGDMFDGPKCDPEPLLRPLADLRLPQGTYFITGNHEYIRDTDVFLVAIRSAGIYILNNEVVDLKGIQLAGVDWKETYQPSDYKRVLETMPIDSKTPSVILRHEPNHLAIAAEHGFSLHLSGHTHRGQIWPLSFITRKIFKGFDYGLKRFGNMTNYTSSGVGTWGPPLRFGTRSEIVVITLE